MTEQPLDSTKRRLDPDIAAELWQNKKIKTEERKSMDPEELAENLSDRLVKILEKEMKQKRIKKAAG